MVIAELVGGILLLIVFAIIETRVAEPMFRLPLFKIRAFTAGTLASFLSVHRAGRAHVHAHHLAPGHLAAAARLRLRPDPAVGRDLHAPAHARAS